MTAELDRDRHRALGQLRAATESIERAITIIEGAAVMREPGPYPAPHWRDAEERVWRAAAGAQLAAAKAAQR